MAKGVWGIDVSKSSVKAVRLEGGQGASPTLTHMMVVPYETAGTGEGQELLDDHIKDALRQLKEACKINEPVLFSLPSHSTFNRLIKLPPVEESKLPEIVRYEAQSQIPFNIDEVIWDYQYVDRVYQPGEEKEVILFAIKRDIVEQFLANIAALGFDVDGVQFAPVSLFNFLVRDQGITAPSVALDMGGDNTDLIVVDGNKFWIRNLPITGNDITKALQKAFNIPFEEAEKLKLKAGQSQQAQKIFNAIQPVLRDLVNEINRSMGYYKSISKTSKFERIILLGNATRTLNFQKFVSQSLQLPAARVQKLNSVAVGGQVDPGELNESLPTLGGAIGLALQGLGDVPNRVNLLPPAEIKKKEIKKKQPYVIAAVALLYALVVFMWYQGSGEIEELKKNGIKANQAITRYNTQIEKFEAVTKVAAIEKQLGPLSGIAHERDLILKIMNEINQNIPENGNWTTSESLKLWVVDWMFTERAEGEVQGGRPGAQRRGNRPLPDKKRLRAVIEVVITKRRTDATGRDFIVKTLLNYDAAGKRRRQAAGGCVIVTSSWHLADTVSEKGYWLVERDQDLELPWPVPSSLPPSVQAEEEWEKKYWRFRVTLDLPVGEENRKDKVAAAKAGNGSSGKK